MKPIDLLKAHRLGQASAEAERSDGRFANQPPTEASASGTAAADRTAQARVLVVDDESLIRKSTTRRLERDGHHCVAVDMAKKALQHLDVAPFDVVVTDIHMPEMSGIDLLKAIKQEQPETQVIVMTGNPNLDFAVEAIRSSADDFLIKPFQLAHLSHAVNRALEHRAILRQNEEYRLHLEEKVEEQAKHIERLFLDGLAVLAAAIEARDRYTSEHLDRVTAYALSTGTQMRLEQPQMWSLWLGSLFHDVGKLAVPDQILNKVGPLTDPEYEVIKQHPELGARIIEKVSFLRPAALGILHHQERWDGKGYPAGLAGEQISIEGRILAVCDAFDAMQSDRPYRKALPLEKAVLELRQGAGTQFDPRVVEAFLTAKEDGFSAKPPTVLSTTLLRAL